MICYESFIYLLYYYKYLYIFIISIITPFILIFCTSGKPRNISDSQSLGDKKNDTLENLNSFVERRNNLSSKLLNKDDKTSKKNLNISNKMGKSIGEKSKNEMIKDNNNNNNIYTCENDEENFEKKNYDQKSKKPSEISTASINVLKDSVTTNRDFNEEILNVNSKMSSIQIERVIDGIGYYKNRPLSEKITSNNKITFGPTIIYTTNDDVTISGTTKENNNDKGDEMLLNIEGKTDLLNRMIINGPKKFVFNYKELMNLLSIATKIFENESSLLICPLPCVVYGDIHGQYSDLFRWFQVNGWPYNTRSVFLGDFVDRGTHGIEVIGLLCALKIKFPKNIYIVRGNHEEEALNKYYSFYDEVLLRFGKGNGEEMYKSFKKLFSYLPLSVLIGKKILAMHGGLSPRLTSLKSIQDIKRPIYDFKINTLACDLVWSDPNNSSKNTGYLPNYNRDPINSIGQLFGIKAIEETFKMLNIDMVIRGHQVPLKGSSIYCNGKIMTLFSAPGYRGKSEESINWGGSCYINEDFVITLKKIKVTKQYRDNRKAEVNLQTKRRKLNIKMAKKSESESEKSDSQRV